MRFFHHVRADMGLQACQDGVPQIPTHLLMAVIFQPRRPIPIGKYAINNGNRRKFLPPIAQNITSLDPFINSANAGKNA